MSITVSRYVYENGVNSLRIEGVKSASINELLNRDHTKCLYIGFDSTEDLQALQDQLNNRRISNSTRNSRNPKKKAYTSPQPEHF